MSLTARPRDTSSREKAYAGPRRWLVPSAALALGGLSVLVAAAVSYLALATARGQDLDDRAMRVFSVNGDHEAARPLVSLLGDVTAGAALVALAVFVVLALIRHGFALAVGAAVLVGGANVTTQLLKHEVLVRPDLGLGTLNSLPSGHMTLVVSMVLAAVLVAPPSARVSLSMIGAALGTLTGAATVVAGWHRPSDVVVATAVSLAWGALVVAVLAFVLPRPSRRAGRGFELLALLGSGAAAALLVAWEVSPGRGPGELPAAVLALGAVGVAVALAVGVFARLAARAIG